MKQKLSVLISILKSTCVCFTVIILALYTAGMAVSDENRTWIPTFAMMWMVLIFSFCLNLAQLLLKIEKIPLAVRIILHYATLAAVFYFVFLLWGGYARNGGTVIAAILVFTLLYAVAAAAVLAVKKPWRKHEQSDSEYKSMLK